MWSDGTPVTVADFQFPFEVARDGVSNVFRTVFDRIDSVEAGASDREVVVTFTTFNPNWAEAGLYPLPEHVLREPYLAGIAADRGLDLLDWNIAPNRVQWTFHTCRVAVGQLYAVCPQRELRRSAIF